MWSTTRAGRQNVQTAPNKQGSDSWVQVVLRFQLTLVSPRTTPFSLTVFRSHTLLFSVVSCVCVLCVCPVANVSHAPVETVHIETLGEFGEFTSQPCTSCASKSPVGTLQVDLLHRLGFQDWIESTSLVVDTAACHARCFVAIQDTAALNCGPPRCTRFLLRGIDTISSTWPHLYSSSRFTRR